MFLLNPDRFTKEILYIGDADYVVKMEALILRNLDAKNDPTSYNMHNGDGKLNAKKVGRLSNHINKANNTGIYKPGFYDSKEFLEGSIAGGVKASKYIKEAKKGIFKEGYFQSDTFKKICSDTGIKNAKDKKGITGRSKEKMKIDNTKASLTLFTCDICGKTMNAGNLSRHKKSKHL